MPGVLRLSLFAQDDRGETWGLCRGPYEAFSFMDQNVIT